MATCINQYGYSYYCNSSWYSWGRWVAVGLIVLALFLFFFLLSCYSQRKRRRQGRQPFYGTGWTQNIPYGAPPQYSSNNPHKQNQVQPQYEQQNQGHHDQNQGGYYGQNQGYFGGQQTDVEMQPPQNVYNNTNYRSEHGFEPPPGPPPSKLR